MQAPQLQKKQANFFKALTPIPGPGLSFQYQTSGKWTGAYRKPFCTQIPFYLLFFLQTNFKKKKLVPRANEVIGGASCKLQLVKISQIENVVQTCKLVAELFSCGVVEVGLTECYKVSKFTIEHRRN